MNYLTRLWRAFLCGFRQPSTVSTHITGSHFTFGTPLTAYVPWGSWNPAITFGSGS